MHERTVTIKRVKSARHLRLRLGRGGAVVVTAPMRATKTMIMDFVREQEGWLQKQESMHALSCSLMMVEHDPVTRARLTADARDLVRWRLEHFNQFYNYTYGQIAIRNQSTRWGSCSSSGNLNFNYRITLLTPELQDYLIVHELCHRGEMNHSDRFWALVARTIPDYKKLSKQLRADEHVTGE